MNEILIQSAGWISTTLLVICNIPQVIKTYRHKKVDDISIIQWWTLFAGFSFGLFYGVGIYEWPIIVARVFNLFVSGSFLILYYKYKKRK